MMPHKCCDLVRCLGAETYITRNASFLFESTAARKHIHMGHEGSLLMLATHPSDVVCACQTCCVSQCCSV